MKITVISFQTFGDYLLKAPFFCELSELYPNAEVTVVTNEKGAPIYPLIDSRLRLAVIDKNANPISIVTQALRVPKADLLFALDLNRPTCVLLPILRAKRKIGWTQSVSRLYFGDQLGFRDRYIVGSAWSRLLRLVFAKTAIRLPEDHYEGHVELALLPGSRKLPRLAQYRGKYSLPRAPRPRTPILYCAAVASWTARQLKDDQWRQILNTLIEEFPEHSLVLDAPDTLAAMFAENPRIERLKRTKDLADLFHLVSSADAVVCSDSFITHLASWYDVPAVSFFGPASPHRFAPTAPGSTVIFHAPRCSPCVQKGGSKPCVAGYDRCLSFQQIQPGEICIALSKALANKATNPERTQK